MAHSNETPILGLPQFLAEDKATWLGDMNIAFSKVDTFAGQVNALAEGASSSAQSALAAAQNAVNTATQAVENSGQSAADSVEAKTLANNALTVANNTAALAQLLNAQTGKVDDLKTTAKILVDAINEIADTLGVGDSTPGGTTIVTQVETISNTLNTYQTTNDAAIAALTARIAALEANAHSFAFDEENAELTINPVED